MNKIEQLFKAVVDACEDLKAEDLLGLDLTNAQSYTDYVVIASANNERQAKAMADRVLEYAFKKCKRHPLGTEGLDVGEWVLIDFGDVVCHIFLEEVRDQYHLEDMWPKVNPIDDFSEFFSGLSVAAAGSA